MTVEKYNLRELECALSAVDKKENPDRAAALEVQRSKRQQEVEHALEPYTKVSGWELNELIGVHHRPIDFWDTLGGVACSFGLLGLINVLFAVFSLNDTITVDGKPVHGLEAMGLGLMFVVLGCALLAGILYLGIIGYRTLRGRYRFR